MTKFQKKAAPQYLIFLKQKVCGKKKGGECADGRNQREYLTKDYISAPTVETEALFLMCIIDAVEHQEVATVEIPGEFMQSDMEGETVLTKMEGKMVYILTKLDPKLYHKYSTTEKVRPVLYVEFKKALYSTIQAALLLWRNLTSSLQECGEQNSLWQTIDSGLACGQYEDFPRKRRRGGRSNQSAQ